jgi:hypothetical protein
MRRRNWCRRGALFRPLRRRAFREHACKVSCSGGAITMPTSTIIPDRGEFIDALQRLRRGHVMVKVSDLSGGCVLDGAPVYTAHRTLLQYGLLSEFHNPHGFANVQYYRLNEQGRAFADRACAQWRQRPLLERLATRLTG